MTEKNSSHDEKARRDAGPCISSLLCALPSLLMPHDGLHQRFGEGVNVIDILQVVPLSLFIALCEDQDVGIFAYVIHSPIKMIKIEKTTYRLAVIVIQQDAAIRLLVTHDDA